jgi:hypothetical protein
MRITVSHNKNPEEIKANINRGFDDIFKGLPVGPVQITDEQRTWVGDTLNFSFNARAAILTVPVKGWILVEQQQVTIEVELPAFLEKLIPAEKMKSAVESGVRGLLT